MTCRGGDLPDLLVASLPGGNRASHLRKHAIFLGIARHVTGRCHTKYFLPRSFGYS